VQALPSLQVEPFGLGPTPQTPPMHVACWHWSEGLGHWLALVHLWQP
jgi:hypothetical protein